MTNLLPHIVLWAILTTVVVFLALWRRRVNLKSDELVHVLDQDQNMVPVQEQVARKLEAIDRWGKILTALSVLYALAIGALYLYKSFTDTSIPQ